MCLSCRIFAYLFAKARKKYYSLSIFTTWICSMQRVVLATYPLFSSLEIATFKQSNTSLGKFQVTRIVQGLEVHGFQCIFLTMALFHCNTVRDNILAGCAKWYLNALFLSRVRFFTTARVNCKTSLPISVARFLFSALFMYPFTVSCKETIRAAILNSSKLEKPLV